MRIAVVGGGINGVMSASALRASGHDVVLLERDRLMGATSSASTKLLHGGLRYLEHGSFRLVREALGERAWWLGQAPHLCRPIPLLLPVRRIGGRSRTLLRVGLSMYDLLAGRSGLGRHRWLDPAELARRLPRLRISEFLGAFEFWDVQMDDHALGMWAAERARAMGVQIHESSAVTRVRLDGGCVVGGEALGFDLVVNCAGPWAQSLLEASGIEPRFTLDLVRGGHIVVDRPCASGMLAEVRGGRRIAFVLPWKERTLVGTTEVRQGLGDPVQCSDDERQYLRSFHDGLFADPLLDSEVVGSFAGIRPLIRSAGDPSRASREYEIDVQGRVLTVYGGKWTTARALGERVATAVRALRPQSVGYPCSP
jgi:glycerol-3-phosphate dehydrogenase